MNTIIIGQTLVNALLPMTECIQQMERIFGSLASGDVLLPLRQVLWLPGNKSALATMPSYWGSEGVTGVKVITVFPENITTDLDSHQGAVLLFETKTGSLLAVIDASSITAIRTAAVSGLATGILAREDSHVLAILGSGVQARTHLEAMLTVRPIDHLFVWSRTLENAKSFGAWASDHFRIKVEITESADKAIKNADIICTVTAARTPVLSGNHLKPGSHVNAIGSFGPASQEIDSETVRCSRFFVDRRESAENEAGDYLIPLHEGIITKEHIRAELAELVSSSAQGRISNSDITVFKSLGLALEDLAAAHHVYKKALKEKIGVSLNLGGVRH